ncbi:MAG: HPr(Ser) kinase/phosphatase [Gemmatimonadota bacterium]|nr:HPr(Ser) kinase/phosphatase [Gemmatimonadota bacterium]MDH3367262.1 HPr(Ser) kinase/phosphatase [Gemmatimonadota bacterium]MDH3479009.1 HPr(Ser) kinase/phosphatase [Gemmatimonadota bacterium]MDH3571617.1 HPr(Ser) kinase/phosphatase [Gemmatimonadota bacterium]MDH5549835.1 HPr(Ser) kinase/phosphatase [Gemmatimonadota bacterium]
MGKPTLTIRDILERKGESLKLEVLTGDAGLDREVRVPEVSSPGLVFAGFTRRFAAERLHALGETEIAYLDSLTADDLKHALERFMSYELPCVFVTKGQEVPAGLVSLGKERNIAVLRSQLGTADFYRKISPYLIEMFAPATQIHASMADVYGVGLLFVGRSGIGKSECVLDLVERGHRLVADDVVHVTLRGAGVLIGRSHELAHRYMEIRGIGLVDVMALFGVRAVRQQKRIEVVVELQDWESAQQDVERTGLDGRTATILGVELPLVRIPLNPGKNLTVICEVVAMNHLLRYSGVDAARQFNERLIQRLVEQAELREYLAEDYE